MGGKVKGKMEKANNENKTIDLSDKNDLGKAKPRVTKVDLFSDIDIVEDGIKRGLVLRVDLKFGGFIMHLIKADVKEEFVFEKLLKLSTGLKPTIIIDYVFGDKEIGFVPLQVPYNMLLAKFGTEKKVFSYINDRIAEAQKVKN